MGVTTRHNLLLIGKTEEIDTVLPQVRAMLGVEGFYVARDANRPEAEIPLAVLNGRVYCFELDKELDPTRFLDSVRIAGPFRGPEVVES